MSWRDCTGKGGDRYHSAYLPITHAGRVVWLWHDEHRNSIYDPRADHWTPLTDPFTPAWVRAGTAMCSTGEELLVWGGRARPAFHSDGKPKSDGARLGKDDAWTPMAARGPSQRSAPVHAWTGRELLIWGGWKDGKLAAGGSAYDPKANTWRKLPARKTSARDEDSVWTGRELWMWDSSVRGDGIVRAGHAYNPEKNDWRDLGILPEEREYARSMARCGDGAILVCKEGHDVDGCAVWRYEPRADLWEPSAPPPREPGAPLIVDCDGRLIVRIGESLFEYLPAKDAWAELPPPALGIDPHLLWVGGELIAFGQKGTRALKLPAEPTPLAAEAAPIVIAAQASPTFTKGSAVTAIAISAGSAIAGYEDGTIRRGDEILRKADGHRITGLVTEPNGWTALIGNRLEGATKAKLGFDGDALAFGDGQLVVAGGGSIVSFVDGAEVERAKAPGTTIHLAVFGGTITRTVLGPEKRGRSETRDTVEARHTRSLKLRLELKGTKNRGTTAAVPAPAGIYLGGAGGYRTELYPHGKKRAQAGLQAFSLMHLTTTSDGQSIAGAGWDGVALYAVSDGRCVLALDAAEPTTIATDGNVVAFGTAEGAVYVVERVTLGITAHAAGKSVILQPPVSEILDAKPPPDDAPRAEPEGQRGVHGWRRWRVGGRVIELAEQAAEVARMPNGSLAIRERRTLVVLSADGIQQRRFAGHGHEIEGLSPNADGSITTWDCVETIRRWRVA